jgi:predicted regulator of Ras-like GTPase activity (Roadblock/LC7/MglB family)
MFPPMTLTHALDELLEVSEDIRAAVVFDAEEASVKSTTLQRPEAAEGVAENAAAMLRLAERLRTDAGGIRQVEAVTREGRVFVVAADDRAVAAVADLEATSQLVFHDLRRCLDA